MKPRIVTVGREYGSGGRLLAKRLANELGIPFYDRELIEMAAKETGFSEDFIRNSEMQKTGSFLYNLYISSQNLPVPDQVFIAQSNIIKRVAEEGPCVIVGRCANYVLRERKDCMHVFIHAPLEQRVRRATEQYGVKAEGAQAGIQKIDKARASYYNHYTGNRWGESRGYDLAVNSGLGEDAVLRALCILARGEADA